MEVFARGGGGVSKVVVTFEKCEAHDTFEDARTSVPKLIQATSDAGYPSPVMQ
ncbi:mercuric transport protein periplasmic component [Pandoraea terrae]|uniref:Mercuric transport protein periplasmic component n=1 Tax=Pandoraea terrae TaxID=1537710 RepID=A0A5E4U2A1_9BURK|nr:mercuric transport protein periplasmic component [Pandoraea terrae]